MIKLRTNLNQECLPYKVFKTGIAVKLWDNNHKKEDYI